MDLRAAQESLARIASDLRRSARRLEALRRALPDPEDAILEQMDRGERPFDVATVLVGTMDCASREWIQRAAEELEKAAGLTQRDLDAEWRADQDPGGS